MFSPQAARWPNQICYGRSGGNPFTFVGKWQLSVCVSWWSAAALVLLDLLKVFQPFCQITTPKPLPSSATVRLSCWSFYSTIALHTYAFSASPQIVVVYRSFEKLLLAGRIDKTKQSFVCCVSAKSWITGSATLMEIRWHPFRPMVHVCDQRSRFLWRWVSHAVWRLSFSTDPGCEWAEFWPLRAFILTLQRSLHACGLLCFRCWTPWPPRRVKRTHSSRKRGQWLPENVCLRLSDVNKRRVSIPESFWWCCSSTEWFVGYTEIQAILCCRSTAREFNLAASRVTPPPGVLLLPDAW